MNEVEVPLKITGIAAIRAELKELQTQLVNATDPKQITELGLKAGALKDQIADANSAIGEFATGSKFEAVSNTFDSMKASLMSLDFEEANHKAQIFAATLGSLNSGDIKGAFKGLIGTIGSVSKAFMAFGAQLLMNPIFLLAAVIIAIVAAVVIFLNKIGVLQKVIDILMMPLNMLIDLFKKLTDWLGLTSFAADENAARMQKANEKVVESSKKRAEATSAQYDHEIAMAEIAGKDIVKLQLEKSRSEEKEAIKRKAFALKTIESMRHMDDEEAIKKRKELLKQVDEENKIIRDGVYKRIQIKAKAHKEEADQEKEAAEKAAEKAKEAATKAREKAKENAANRLKAARELRDYELSLIKDQTEREIAIAQEKYKRLREDLKTDNTKTAAEKIKYLKMYNEQEKAVIKELNDAKKKLEAENLLKSNQAIADLRLQLMKEGITKELALNHDKYEKLREQTKKDTTIVEEKKKEIIDLYNELEKQDREKIIAARTKQQETMLQALQDRELSAKDKALKDLKTKYEQEQKLAEGNYELQLELYDKYEEDQKKIRDDAAVAAIETKQKERDAIISAASDIFNGVSGFVGMLIKDQKKLEKFNKATALVQIGIDTAKAISALVAQAQANPYNSITAGAAGVAQFASGIIQIATNIAKAKQILTSGGTPSTGGGGTSSEASGGGSASVAQQVPQAAQLFGGANIGNVFKAGSASTETPAMTITAVVSETQITNVQKKITQINKNAEL